jgi:hypothetical protein
MFVRFHLLACPGLISSLPLPHSTTLEPFRALRQKRLAIAKTAEHKAATP